MRRGSSGLCGVLAIDKPAGMSSHDVVNTVRKICGERRVGHTGTLDPMATGLMFVGVGAATRLSTYLTGHDKGYIARIVFGAVTDTDDACGRLLGGDVEMLKVLKDVDAGEVLDDIVGTQMQMPPAYCAIKKNGVSAYKAAREGRCIKLEPRMVTVYSARFVGSGMQKVSLALSDAIQAQATGLISDGERVEGKLPYWDVEFEVSKGTYIRAIARDLGAVFGCGAYLNSLRRISIGAVNVDCAYTLKELVDITSREKNFPWCDPTDLLGLPIVRLSDSQARAVSNGRAIDARPWTCGKLVSCVASGRLMAVYAHEDGKLKPATVIPGGVAGAA